MEKTDKRKQQGSKSAQIKAVGQAQPDDLLLINQHTRNALTADQVYTMKLSLCDNEIDRQNDQFTPNALNQLAALFVGKTVIFDHNWSAKNQTARIYSTSVESVQGQSTSNGQPFMQLVAMAYMLNIECNADIIAALDGGILKEGSVGFANTVDTCSICGQGYYSPSCAHFRGQEYVENGVSKTCYVTIDGITDAYEFSLVAVPAQRGAGVIKSLKDGRALSAETVKKLKAARALRLQAMDCENQARIIEDELVGGWPDDEEPVEPEDSDETKALKSQIYLLIGGKKE